MKMKKFKKTKGSGDSGLGLGGGPLNQVVKDPIIFNEDYDFKFEPGYAFTPKMLDLDSVHPIGTMTEEFLTTLKQGIVDALEQAR